MGEFESEEFVNRRIEAMGDFGNLLDKDYLKTLNDGLEEAGVNFSDDTHFTIEDGEELDFTSEKDKKKLNKALNAHGFDKVAEKIAETQKIDPRRVENALTQESIDKSKKNAVDKYGDESESADEKKKTSFLEKVADKIFTTANLKRLFIAGSGIGILEAMAISRSGCYLVDGLGQKQGNKIAGISNSECACKTPAIKTTCRAACTIRTTSTDACVKGLCDCEKKHLQPKYFKENFWDTFAYFVGQAGMIVDDFGNLVDASLKTPSAFMSWFKYVLIAAGVIVAIMIIGWVVKMFRK
jgi:hypothetical protein